MVQVSKSMKPSKIAEFILSIFVDIIPTWPIVPSKDLVDLCFKDPQKREIARSNPLRYAIGKQYYSYNSYFTFL